LGDIQVGSKFLIFDLKKKKNTVWASEIIIIIIIIINPQKKLKN